MIATPRCAIRLATLPITASASPLAQLALGPSQILLAVDHPEDFDRYSPMVSRLLHLIAVDILTTGVALRLGQHLRPVLQEIKALSGVLGPARNWDVCVTELLPPIARHCGFRQVAGLRARAGAQRASIRPT